MNNLVNLAKLNQLPEHQYMDADTLEWIRLNQPFDYKVASKKINSQVVIEKIKELKPKLEWFLEPKTIDSIHGMRHILRVMVHTHILSVDMQINETQHNEVMIAAATHDLRRLNDKGDHLHGLRAAKWIKSNSKMLSSYYSEDINWDAVMSLVEFHEKPDNQGSIINRYKTQLDILKTADALDRYRQPKLKWRINDIYLNLLPSDTHKQFAYELVLESEKKHLDGLDNFNCILQALQSYV